MDGPGGFDQKEMEHWMVLVDLTKGNITLDGPGGLDQKENGTLDGPSGLDQKGTNIGWSRWT